MNARARIRNALVPRLLNTEEAAAYCGVTVATFKADCPVIPIKIRECVRFDREQIDRWIDSKSQPGPESPSGKEWLERLENAGAREGH